MESKNLVYKNGHFYDKGTGVRVGLRDGSEIHIEASNNDFMPSSEVGKWPKLLNSEEKEFKIKSEDNLVSHTKIYEKGSSLYFSITRTFKKNSVITHKFKVELLEDLYFYLKHNWEKERLFDCACTVKENISNTLDYFEEIRAKSLNEAYKNTFVHFFENKGNPACNAIDRFYDDPNREDLTIGRFRKEVKDKKT